VYFVHIASTLKQIGRQVRIARIEKGMSPERFGASYGLSGMTIRRLEDGRQKRIDARTMCRIAEGLDRPVNEVFDL
jgi:transcriptional regulator with XRE-family HTH domain